MKRICAWCNSPMGDLSSNVHNEHAITHGICDSCLHSIFSDKNINFIPFLNTIDAPVVLIDDNNTYLSANNSALSIIDREHLQLQNQRTGDIFTCENSKLTGGCGHTDMCGGCQMLQLISKTYTAKNAFNNIPVTLTRAKGKVREKLNLHISTERMNNLVLLRIDQFDTKFEYQS